MPPVCLCEYYHSIDAMLHRKSAVSINKSNYTQVPESPRKRGIAKVVVGGGVALTAIVVTYMVTLGVVGLVSFVPQPTVVEISAMPSPISSIRDRLGVNASSLITPFNAKIVDAIENENENIHVWRSNFFGSRVSRDVMCGNLRCVWRSTGEDTADVRVYHFVEHRHPAHYDSPSVAMMLESEPNYHLISKFATNGFDYSASTDPRSDVQRVAYPADVNKIAASRIKYANVTRMWGATFVARNCNSARARLVTKVARFFPVYALSSCRPPGTIRGSMGGRTKRDAISRYTHHLAFENSIADGYVTEKIWDAISTGAIPIYSGASDVKRYVGFEPLRVNSVIAAGRMQTPQNTWSGFTPPLETYKCDVCRLGLRYREAKPVKPAKLPVNPRVSLLPSKKWVIWSRNWYRMSDCSGPKWDAYVLNYGTEEHPHIENIPKCEGSRIWIRMGTDAALSDINKFKPPTHPYELITSDGDLSVPSQLPLETQRRLLQDPNLKTWYTQNCAPCTHPKMKPIPIGLDLHTYRGMTYDGMKHMAGGGHTNGMILFDGMNRGSNKERSAADLGLSCIPHEHHAKMSQKRTFAEYSDHMRGISPPGNGLDCHRNWELIFLGVVPIVKKGILDALYSKLPHGTVQIVRDWKDACDHWTLTVPDARVLDMRWWIPLNIHVSAKPPAKPPAIHDRRDEPKISSINQQI